MTASISYYIQEEQKNFTAKAKLRPYDDQEEHLESTVSL